MSDEWPVFDTGHSPCHTWCMTNTTATRKATTMFPLSSIAAKLNMNHDELYNAAVVMITESNFRGYRSPTGSFDTLDLTSAGVAELADAMGKRVSDLV